jgi:hypothetical protein
MKNNKNTHNKIYISLAMLMLLGISFVSAFSVSSPYMENKTLNLFPDSKITDLQFVLQNGGGATENVSIKVNILEGSEIASLLEESDIHTVSPGEKIPVNLRITLPKDAIVGKSYNIRLEFTTVSSGQSGEFGFGTGQEQNFKVVIVKEVVPENNLISNAFSKKISLYLIIGILLVLLIISFVWSKRRSKKTTKK